MVSISQNKSGMHEKIADAEGSNLSRSQLNVIVQSRNQQGFGTE
jgi:hypothetical protein